MNTAYVGHPGERQRAEHWARELLTLPDWVILDTESTGLGPTDEVVEIAVLAPNGVTLFDTLIRPSRPIPFSATVIHGIGDAAVAAAPTYAQVAEQLEAVIQDKHVVCYNAEFDERLLTQSAFLNGVRPPLPLMWLCAMKEYARFVGQWSEQHGNYTLQPLPPYKEKQHRALDDCRSTLAVIHHMSGAPWPTSNSSPSTPDRCGGTSVYTPTECFKKGERQCKECSGFFCLSHYDWPRSSLCDDCRYMRNRFSEYLERRAKSIARVFATIAAIIIFATRSGETNPLVARVIAWFFTYATVSWFETLEW